MDHSPILPIESELERLAAIVHSSDDAIIAKSLDGTIRSWNPAAERMFGYAADEIVGRSILTLVPPELHPEEEAILARIRAGEHVTHYETSRVRKDGRRIIISLTISPLHNASGALIGASAIKRDITLQRRLEEQLRQAQKMEALGKLAGGIAHDFNNILTIIQGFASFVGKTLGPASPAHDDVMGITRATERAAGLIGQLLTFSRQQPLRLEVFDLSTLVQETASMLGRLIGEQIHLELRLAGEPALVQADRNQLSQVLINLALNARDAMPTGGTLTLGTYVDPVARQVILSIRDTGLGMDAVTRSHLFEPFFSTKPRGQGTGLGLATAYGIVSTAGGHIDVSSEPGHGSVFRVLLPRSAEAPAAQPPVSAPRNLSGTETVLVVDDEPELVHLISRVLAGYGYTVIPAVGPGAAMVAFGERSTGIDLLLTDVIMPVTTGPVLAERLRANDPELTVIFMSGYSENTLPLQGTGGETPLLSKPFSPDALARCVREVLDRRAAGRVPSTASFS
jgi:two-component system cell cycle sensor histidine kinase/response regulator CckA